jgi:hypothetical protein
MYFSAAPSSENAQQHELGLEHLAGGFDPAVLRGRHPAQRRMSDLPLHVRKNLPGIGLVPTSV